MAQTTKSTTAASATPTEAPAAPDHPPFIAIEVHPEALKRNGPVRLPVFVDAVPNQPNNADLIMEGSFLPSGSQVLPWEEYEKMQQNRWFNFAVKKRLIIVHRPVIAKKLTGTSADYESETALTLIAQSNDADWLDRCIAKDSREGMAEACQDRKKVIADELSRTDIGDDEE